MQGRRHPHSVDHRLTSTFGDYKQRIDPFTGLRTYWGTGNVPIGAKKTLPAPPEFHPKYLKEFEPPANKPCSVFCMSERFVDDNLFRTVEGQLPGEGLDRAMIIENGLPVIPDSYLAVLPYCHFEDIAEAHNDDIVQLADAIHWFLQVVAEEDVFSHVLLTINYGDVTGSVSHFHVQLYLVKKGEFRGETIQKVNDLEHNLAQEQAGNGGPAFSSQFEYELRGAASNQVVQSLDSSVGGTKIYVPINAQHENELVVANNAQTPLTNFSQFDDPQYFVDLLAGLRQAARLLRAKAMPVGYQAHAHIPFTEEFCGTSPIRIRMCPLYSINNPLPTSQYGYKTKVDPVDNAELYRQVLQALDGTPFLPKVEALSYRDYYFGIHDPDHSLRVNSGEPAFGIAYTRAEGFTLP
ncbi:MAG TPA: hypothetical protein PKB15_02210 [Acidimicrobiia bacterium]|nr:hypothetical protein [Acidimicrobiia bacterium]